WGAPRASIAFCTREAMRLPTGSPFRTRRTPSTGTWARSAISMIVGINRQVRRNRLAFQRTAVHGRGHPAHARSPAPAGPPAEKDQNFGGIRMNAEQSAVFLAAIFYFLL